MYTYSGNTYNYYFNSHARDSWNGAGAIMYSYVHGTPAGQNNAVYSAGATYYGDGNGVTFGPLSSARDVVGHEWTHGVTESEANLVYSGESGALNEAMSDIFGAAVEISVTGITANSWKIGEDAYTPGTGGDALRYMNDPAADSVSYDYYPEMNPSADIHYTSGIGNLTFYLLVSGGTHPRGKTSISVTGIGNVKAERIFYLALRDKLLSNDNYPAARNKTAQVAQEQYGLNSTEHLNTCKAWDAVAVPQAGNDCPAPPAPSVPQNLRKSPATGFDGNYTILWDASTGAVSYYILEENFSPLYTITAPSTSKSFTNKPCGEYEYRAKACTVGGLCSGYSNTTLKRVCNL